MIRINDNYLKLKASYLFSTIAKRVAAHQQRQPDPAVIRLGIGDVTRALPHAMGPEKSLLSSMLQDPQEYIGVAIEEKLTKEHFYLPAHSTLYDFLIDLFEAGQEVELVSLVQRLLDRRAQHGRSANNTGNANPAKLN